MDKYTYRVTWSEEDGEYVGLCAEFPSLSWLANTQEAALAGIKDTVHQVIQDMKSTGETVPEPLATRSYSGKFTVRIPPEVHRKLQIEAAEENISFNRLISAKLTC
jgi:predicted HicB family RNase H-like nuclease